MGSFFGLTANPEAVGGKKFLGTAPAVAKPPVHHSLVFTAADDGAGVAVWDASGALGTTISGSFLGSPPAFGQMADNEIDCGLHRFVVRLPCTTPANAFATLTFSGGFTHTLHESDAVFKPGCGFNEWIWPGPIGMPEGPVINLDIT